MKVTIEEKDRSFSRMASSRDPPKKKGDQKFLHLLQELVRGGKEEDASAHFIERFSNLSLNCGNTSLETKKADTAFKLLHQGGCLEREGTGFQSVCLSFKKG